MNPLDEAIQHMEHEIERYALMKPGTSYWLVRQASAAGLSFLNKAKQLGLDSPEAVDRFRKQVRADALKLNDEDSTGIVSSVEPVS